MAGRRTPHADDGYSLVELVTAMALLGLVLAMATALFISTTRSTGLAQGMDANTRVATNAMDEIGRVLRVGTTVAVTGSATPRSAFVYADREQLVLFSNVDVDPYASVTTLPPKPTMVRFRLDGGRQLWEDRLAPTASGIYWVFPSAMGTADSSRSLGGTVLAAPTGQDAFFTYLDQSNTVLPVPATGGLSATQLAQVTAVRVTLRITATNSRAGKPATVVNTVLLPNVTVTKVTS
ncbi:hypothetical protein DOE76_19430 [Leifsonia sp. ku-ls]|nr:hypothetical protein DOE76_19430 [Leifsonia sp. ku-ls]